MSKVYLGIDVGGTKLAYGLFDEELKVIGKRRSRSMPEAPADVMIDAMAFEVDALFREAGCERSLLAGVGAVFPSHIDQRRDVIVTTSNLPHWNEIPVQALLSEKFGAPVKIDNDANGAALAEHRLGAGRGREHMIYITVSTGVGGGMIIDNKLFRGTFGMAGEFGHMFISDAHGGPCGCGNTGCIESIATGPQAERYIAQRIEEGVETCLKEISGGERVTTRHLGEGVKRGDAFSIEVVTHIAEYLARMYVSLYQALNIDLVVYGGGLMNITMIMEIVKRRFAEMVNYSKLYPVEFAPAMLGEDCCLIGSALLAAAK